MHRTGREVDTMRKGVVILRDQASTLELRGQVREVLTGAGFECEARQRFDGIMIVAFGRASDKPDSSVEEVEKLLRSNVLLESAPLVIKAQE